MILVMFVGQVNIDSFKHCILTVAADGSAKKVDSLPSSPLLEISVLGSNLRNYGTTLCED